MFQGREKLRADEQNRDVLGIFRCWGVSMVTPLDDPSVSGRQGALLLAGCGSPTTWTLSSHRPWSHDLPLGSDSCLLKLIHHILQKPWIDAELIMFLIPPPCLWIPLGSTFSSSHSLPNLLLPYCQVLLSVFLHIYFPSFPFSFYICIVMTFMLPFTLAQSSSFQSGMKIFQIGELENSNFLLFFFLGSSTGPRRSDCREPAMLCCCFCCARGELWKWEPFQLCLQCRQHISHVGNEHSSVQTSTVGATDGDQCHLSPWTVCSP